MPEIDSRAELAPRDVVARAMDSEMKRLDTDCLFLDISHRRADFIHHHFPMIHSKLLALDIDLTTEPVPVVPAAHYTCGGVLVDKTGQTDVSGLYAIGEVACTGLHGANRLASNSLLECLVYGWSAANHLDQWLSTTQLTATLPAWCQNMTSDTDLTKIERDLHQLRTLMWAHVGIVRTTHGLEYALGLIAQLKQKSRVYSRHQPLSARLLTLRSLSQVAELIVRCALQRKESRGLHYTVDYPATDSAAAASVLQPDNYIKR